MNRRPFALGVAVGCLLAAPIAPLSSLLADRYAGRHWLALNLQENP